MKIVLIVLCLTIAGCDQLTNNSPDVDPDHFKLTVDSRGDAWVLDTRTGELRRCWQGIAGSTPPTCYNAIKK